MDDNNEHKLSIPEHVAIIMDGNGRWSKKKNLPREFGHRQGGKVLEQICKDAYSIGIKYLTVFAFSTENWKRSDEEVSTLMNILREYLTDCIKKSNKNKMKVMVIGDRSRFDEDIRKKIDDLEEASKNNDGLILTIALNYGGRDDIVRAVRKIANDITERKITVDNIDEDLFSNYLDTNKIPDPDLLIRTSGEQRISNFLLWQFAYSEFYFSETLWPDFTKKDLVKAIEQYNLRERRFGGR